MAKENKKIRKMVKGGIMKIDLERKISVYMFVIIVLAFVLLFHLISSSQMKFTVNKIMESQKIEVKETYTPTNYTKSTQEEVKKYQNYDY